jgi:hypothetical protein
LHALWSSACSRTLLLPSRLARRARLETKRYKITSSLLLFSSARSQTQAVVFNARLPLDEEERLGHTTLSSSCASYMLYVLVAPGGIIRPVYKDLLGSFERRQPPTIICARCSQPVPIDVGAPAGDDVHPPDYDTVRARATDLVCSMGRLNTSTDEYRVWILVLLVACSLITQLLESVRTIHSAVERTTGEDPGD